MLSAILTTKALLCSIPSLCNNTKQNYCSISIVPNLCKPCNVVFLHGIAHLVDKVGLGLRFVHGIGVLVDKVGLGLWFVHGIGVLVDKVRLGRLG